MGSTRLLTDEDGEPTDEYAYDAYGSTISHTGPTSDNPYQWVGALGYYTHYQAPEFKLIQLGFRFYDPEIGRFTQQDPIKSGLNWYQYASGDPLGSVDPWGLYDCECARRGRGYYLFGNLPFADAIVTAYVAATYAWEDAYYWISNNVMPQVQETVALGISGGPGARLGEGALAWIGARYGTRALGKAAATAERVVLHGHHPLPKYLGGHAKQTLQPLEEGLHLGAYHAGLQRVLPQGAGKAAYRSMSGQAQAEVFDIFRVYTMGFDDVYGTKLWPAVVDELTRY